MEKSKYNLNVFKKHIAHIFGGVYLFFLLYCIFNLICLNVQVILIKHEKKCHDIYHLHLSASIKILDCSFITQFNCKYLIIGQIGKSPPDREDGWEIKYHH